jgi:hypothetical protein
VRFVPRPNLVLLAVCVALTGAGAWNAATPAPGATGPHWPLGLAGNALLFVAFASQAVIALRGYPFRALGARWTSRFVAAPHRTLSVGPLRGLVARALLDGICLDPGFPAQPSFRLALPGCLRIRYRLDLHRPRRAALVTEGPRRARRPSERRASPDGHSWRWRAPSGSAGLCPPSAARSWRISANSAGALPDGSHRALLWGCVVLG